MVHTLNITFVEHENVIYPVIVAIFQMVHKTKTQSYMKKSFVNAHLQTRVIEMVLTLHITFVESESL